MDLEDVEVTGDGRVHVGVRAAVLDELTGEAAGPELLGILEVLPDGTVVVDGVADRPDYLHPDLSYGRTFEAPSGGIGVGAGRARRGGYGFSQ